MLLQYDTIEELKSIAEKGCKSDFFLWLKTLPQNPAEGFEGGAVHAMVRSKNVLWLKLLLNHGFSNKESLSDELNWTPLHLAVHEGFLEGVQELIASGAPVDFSESNPAKTNLLALCLFMMHYSLDEEIPAPQATTQQEIFNLLILSGAPLDDIRAESPPLKVAAACDDLKNALALIHAGLSINSKDCQGECLEETHPDFWHKLKSFSSQLELEASTPKISSSNSKARI